MTHRSSIGLFCVVSLYNFVETVLEHCTLAKRLLSIWRTFPNLKGYKIPILVPSYCWSGLLQLLSISLLPDGWRTTYTSRCHYVFIHWPPKETLQSSLLCYLIKCDYMTFLHLVKVVRDVFEDKCQTWTRWSEAKHVYVDLNGLRDLHDISTSGYYEGEKI